MPKLPKYLDTKLDGRATWGATELGLEGCEQDGLGAAVLWLNVKA